jgi:UDP-3-O-[3-hydroxymyristoyl] glucosamine N-acyltransferase
MKAVPFSIVLSIAPTITGSVSVGARVVVGACVVVGGCVVVGATVVVGGVVTGTVVVTSLQPTKIVMTKANMKIKMPFFIIPSFYSYI